jgi:4-hydroxyphenylpyruvate dioxygenase
MADDLGVKIVALQPFRDFEAMPPAQRKANFERAARKFELMQDLGAELLSLCSNVSEASIDDPARAAADLRELAELAERSGMRIGYEALAWGRHVKDWTQAWDLVRAADHPALGLVLDSFHACVRNNPIAPIGDIPGDRIALVQIADSPRLLMDPLALSRHHRCFPGQGELPMAEYLAAVLRTGYRGPVSLEIFNEQFRGASSAQIALDGMRSLRRLAEETAPIADRDGATRLRQASAVLPDAPKSVEVEYVEFAADEDAARKLAAMLDGLGFQLVGRHRSKQVDLWRQNGVNVVVNRDSDGFSHAFQLMHGASVCALALRVPDPQEAMARAEALGVASHRGRIGPGEAQVPALRGLEGSLLYLVEADPRKASIWDRDFHFQDDAAAPGPLLRVDHLSNMVRRSEFLSWITFYKAVLGFEDVPQVEVFDPYGAFYSRCVRSPDGKVQIPINVADGGATGVSRFIEAAGGAGVQQIAFETRDLFSFVESARAKGVPFLDIPANYYLDLAARFDLAPEFLDRLQSLNILYDRIGDGELLHIYTEAFEDRFFFEVLERRNYAQFGAANTPVRLAAQAARQDERAQDQRAWSG